MAISPSMATDRPRPSPPAPSLAISFWCSLHVDPFPRGGFDLSLSEIEGGYIVEVTPDVLMTGKCDTCEEDVADVTLRFAADETAARRYRVGDKIEVVAFKRSAREEPKS